MTIEVETRHIAVPRKYTNHTESQKRHPSYSTETDTSIVRDRRISHREGGKNPYWRHHVRAGQQAGTSLSAYRYYYDVKPYYIEAKYPNGGSYAWSWTGSLSYGNYLSTVYSLPAVPSDLSTKADNRAKSSYVSEANNLRRVMNSGEMIGEFAELARQVSNPGKALRTGLGAYVETVKKRTQRSSVRRLPKNRRSAEQAKLIRDSWLEYQFGWRPLVSEIDNVIDYINEEDPFSRYEARRCRGFGVAEDSWYHNGSSGYNYFTPGRSYWRARVRDFVRVIVVYRGQLRTQTSAAGYVSEKLGMHPTDWIPTAWELVPYSFLIDYFTNIGDIISACNLPSNTLAWTMKTTIVQTELRSVDGYIEWDPPGGVVDVIAAEPSHVSKRQRSVERVPYSGSFIPKVEFSIPNTGTKWLNMAALFVGSRYVQKLLR